VKSPGSIAAPLLATLLLLATPPASGSRIPLRVYRNADGLPQTQVGALAQDLRGEIWVGTYCGAARFDGAAFHQLSSSSGLPGDYVNDFAVDPLSGDVWIAAGEGIARIAGGDLSRPAEVVAPAGLPPRVGQVRDLFVDRAGRLLAVTSTGTFLRKDRGGIVRIAVPEVDADALQVIAEGPAGEILLGTERGLLRIDGDRMVPWRSDPGPWTGPVRMLFVPPGGNELLLATPGALWSLAGEAVREIRGPAGEPIPSARAAILDRRGILWVATGEGLFRRSGDRVERFGAREGLPTDRVFSVLEDREGILWFGTENGLAKMPEDVFRTFGAADGLACDSVWSFGVDSAGRLLGGTEDGAFLFDGSRWSPFPGGGPLRGRIVRAIADDGAGALWFGTRNDGVFRFEGGRWRQFLPPEFPSNRVYCSLRSRRGELWFGTRTGVARWSAGRFRVWHVADGLPDETAWMIREDPEGRIVVATDRGLSRLEGERFVVPPEFEEFRKEVVRAFVFDRGGTLWVGTYGRGLARRSGGRWELLPDNQGPSNDFIWGLVADGAGRLWVATNRGIDLFDGRSWRNFSTRDGMTAEEIAVNAALAAPDGSVWFGFGGGSGATRFEVPARGPRPVPPLVRFVDVEAGGRSRGAPERLELAWSERDVTFSWVGVSFRDESKVVYRTRLEGYDADWSKPESARSKRYTNLEPRTYRFLVLARSADGSWTPGPATVVLIVRPPFWAAWWFRLLAILALSSLLGGGVAWQLRRVTRENERLEQTVRERTRSLEEQMAVISDLKEKYERLSITDPLTGLANRRFFLEQLDREIARARRHREGIGLVIIDLDHFKEINDRHGHQAGDLVLVRFARILEEWIRKSDLVARYGGEEFVIAFLHADREGALERTEALRRHLEEERLDSDGAELRITLSAGFFWTDFAERSAEPFGFDDMARLADQALYRAKAKGRNRVEVAEGAAAPTG
jgi:diguanylate cyclase (GGDEF)-like protein